MVNNLVFRWPKPLFFMVLGGHGIHINHISWVITIIHPSKLVEMCMLNRVKHTPNPNL